MLKEKQSTSKWNNTLFTNVMPNNNTDNSELREFLTELNSWPKILFGEDLLTVENKHS